MQHVEGSVLKNQRGFLVGSLESRFYSFDSKQAFGKCVRNQCVWKWMQTGYVILEHTWVRVICHSLWASAEWSSIWVLVHHRLLSSKLFLSER